jgi:hypothetical protein
MTTYSDKTASISREPCQLLIMTLDYCDEEFGVPPCQATASTKCYNTFFTCRDQANYNKTTKDYKFTEYKARLPFPGPLPYIDSLRLLPTVIGQDLTVSGRIKANMLDELHDDVGVDPYVSERSSVQGEFWKKLIARNPNYKGRPVKIYDGYIGMTEAEYLNEPRWEGSLDNITVTGGTATLDCVDSLVNLEAYTYPERINSALNASITDSDTAIVLTSILKEDGVTQIDSSGYVQIEDEIIYYTSVTAPSNQINVPGGGRGYFSTAAAAHDSGTRVTLVKYFAPANPFVQMKAIWDDAGGDWANEFDTTEWTKWQTWPSTDVNFSAIITEDDSLKASDAFWEIAKILDLLVWQNEAQKITVRRNISNDPDRTYTDITDAANVISQSGGVDYNDKERKTRVVHYWNKTTLGEFSNPASFEKIDIGVLSTSESADANNGIIKEEIFNRWVSLRFLSAADAVPWVSSATVKRLKNREFARPLITVALELKDEGNKTGDAVAFSTDERLDANGNPIQRNHLIIKRDKQGGKILLTLKELPKQRLCIIAPAANPATYALSSDAEREYGFIAGALDNKMPNGDEGYIIG